MTVTPADDLTRLLRAVAPKLRRLADIDNELGHEAETERRLADRCDIYADQLTDAHATIVCPDELDADQVGTIDSGPPDGAWRRCQLVVGRDEPDTCGRLATTTVVRPEGDTRQAYAWTDQGEYEDSYVSADAIRVCEHHAQSMEAKGWTRAATTALNWSDGTLTWSDGQPIRAHVDPAELALREAQDDARNEETQP